VSPRHELAPFLEKLLQAYEGKAGANSGLAWIRWVSSGNGEDL